MQHMPLMCEIMCVYWLYLCIIDYLINFHYYPASPRYSSAKVKITSRHTIWKNTSSENIFLISQLEIRKMTNIRRNWKRYRLGKLCGMMKICCNSDNKLLQSMVKFLRTEGHQQSEEN